MRLPLATHTKPSNRFKHAVVTLWFTVALSACQNTPPVVAFNTETPTHSKQVLPEFNSALFSTKDVITIDEITRLDENQITAFLNFYNDPKFALTPTHTRVATYLGILLDQFTYSDKTYTAQQTLDNLTGNCLSLTVLSTALAELVDVDIHFQLLEENPVYSINRNLLVTSDHLRAVLKAKPIQSDSESTSRVSYTRIDYFDTNGLSFVDKISVNTQFSFFYSNLAIEYLAANNINTAYSYAKKALDINSNNASALNTMGILHRKRGDLVSAEQLYEFGARYYSKAPLFIRNYAHLLASQDREIDLSDLVSINTQSSASHPWQWVRAGKKAFSNGHYNDALAYYQKALRVAPDIPQIHLFAGQASFAAGHEIQSKQHFSKAYSLSKDPLEQYNYKRKLLALKARLSH